MAQEVQVAIPATIGQAEERLASIDSLVTAKNWHRAAIVAAFVTLTEGKGKRNVTSDISPVEFAAKGIAGLRSKNTVQRYVEAWEASGHPRPVPGESVTLPDLPFPPNTDMPGDDQRNERLREAGQAEGMPTGSKVVDVANNPKAVKAAIKADPDLAREVASDPEAFGAVVGAHDALPSTQDNERSRRRGERERASRDSNEPTWPLGWRGAATLLDLSSMVEALEAIPVESLTEQQRAEASLFSQAFRNYGARVEAWLGGAYEPMSDADFNREVEVLLGGAQ